MAKQRTDEVVLVVVVVIGMMMMGEVCLSLFTCLAPAPAPSASVFSPWIGCCRFHCLLVWVYCRRFCSSSRLLVSVTSSLISPVDVFVVAAIQQPVAAVGESLEDRVATLSPASQPAAV